MTKSVHNDVLDEALDYLSEQSKRMTVCNATPTTYTEAVSTFKLAVTNVSGADFTGPADGDTSGRKITIGQKTNVAVSTTGSANSVALVETSGGGKLLYVTEVSATQQLVGGNTMTFNSWKVEIADPT